MALVVERKALSVPRDNKVSFTMLFRQPLGPLYDKCSSFTWRSLVLLLKMRLRYILCLTKSPRLIARFGRGVISLYCYLYIFAVIAFWD